jgi:hypothetical protein
LGPSVSASQYRLPVASVQFWLHDWEHECCGDLRKVGDKIEVGLLLEGSVEPTSEPNRIESEHDGTMTLVGNTLNPKTRKPSQLVRIGRLRFGYPGPRLKGQVRCRGKLWEERHGPKGPVPVGVTKGRITGIKWRPAIYGTDASRSEELVRIGYGEGRAIPATSEYPGRPKPISPLVADILGNPERYEGVTITPSPHRRPAPSGWAFVFTVEF